jgi:hypothetical protein
LPQTANGVFQPRAQPYHWSSPTNSSCSSGCVPVGHVSLICLPHRTISTSKILPAKRETPRDATVRRWYNRGHHVGFLKSLAGTITSLLVLILIFVASPGNRIHGSSLEDPAIISMIQSGTQIGRCRLGSTSLPIELDVWFGPVTTP